MYLLLYSEIQIDTEFLESATTSTTLSSCGVGWDRSAIFDTSNLHTSTSKSTKGLLGT